MANVEAKICPLCGKDNNCLHSKDCWCMETTIPKELLEKIPAEKRGKACICKSCVEEFKKMEGKKM